MPGGTRLPWAQVPAGLRLAAEQQLGGAVVEAITQPGGFSPGAAARLRLDTGRRAFAKAVGPELNPDSPGIYRMEARIAAALPAHVPAPRLLGTIEDDGWVLLLFEDIDGAMPAQPWRPPELARVLAALTDLATSLTPAPFDAPALADANARAFAGWRGLLAQAGRGTDGLTGLDRWARDHLAELAELEAGWPAAGAGAGLVHTDLRADNILLTADRVVFVDWPWACIGAPWVDLLCMAPSIAMQGGPPAEEVFTGHPVARDADPAAVTAVLAALAGYFVRASRQPDPPGIPTVRAFQAAQGAVTLDWLRLRTGWR
ncbi:MAG TPA: aminoglycoside phosphotransferase family protein [Streptosporangiaceae bacterium]|nr:aminoglycoside phosphotransferase family protein [Streptosporangiaceae bacterium]